MILSKIKKHFSIGLVRFNQNKELNKIRSERNNMLDLVLDSFSELKSNKISKEDLKVFQDCENYRTKLLQDDTLISYDLFEKNKKTPVRTICQKASSKPIWSQFLFFLVKRQNQPYVLEIGTNLGVSGSYILSALCNKKNAHFMTMEGVPGLCEIAAQKFQKIDPHNNHKIILGLYEKTFSEILSSVRRYNTFFIDGNHQKGATLNYFNQLKSVLQQSSIMIFDDINWSRDMRLAWSIIKDNKDVSYSIDFFKWGIIIIDSHKSKNKKHFKLHLAY